MKTLLLVEDDKMLQEIITEFFSRRDYSVFVCDFVTLVPFSCFDYSKTAFWKMIKFLGERV